MTDAAALVSRAYEYAQDGILALMSCLDCADGYGTVNVNGVSYEVMQLLGEGGFSMVYLVRDRTSGRMYALKKVKLIRKFTHLRIFLFFELKNQRDRSGVSTAMSHFGTRLRKLKQCVGSAARTRCGSLTQLL